MNSVLFSAGGTPQKGPGPSPVPQMNNSKTKPHLEDGPPPYNDVPRELQDHGPSPHRMVNEGPRKQPSPKVQGPPLNAGQSPHQGPPQGRAEPEPHHGKNLSLITKLSKKNKSQITFLTTLLES